MIKDKEVTRIWKITITFVIMWFDIAFRENLSMHNFSLGFWLEECLLQLLLRQKDSLTANGSKGAVARFES